MKHDEAIRKIICELHFEHGMSYSTLAAVYGMSRNAISGIIHRYRERYEAEGSE